MVRFTVFPPLPVFRSFATTAWILPYRRRAHPSHDQLSVVGAPSMLECRRIAADDGVNPGWNQIGQHGRDPGPAGLAPAVVSSPIHLVWKRRARGNKNRYKGFFIIDC